MCHQSGVDERVHTYSLTYGQSIICFYLMGLHANFTMMEVASSANSYANCHYDIYQDTFGKTQFLQLTGFHGFILIVFSLLDSGVSSQNVVFSCDGCQKVVGCMFLKKGRMKKERGLIQTSALWMFNSYTQQILISFLFIILTGFNLTF